MNKSRNFNYGTNNNSNNNGGIMIMTNNSIMTMEVFAGTVKAAMEAVYGAGYRVKVQDVVKNNSRHLTGLSILKTGYNLAPTIYLEELFEDYIKGLISMEQVSKEVNRIYEENKGEGEFNVTAVMDFEQAKDIICYKLVNAKRNQEMLSDTPHIIFNDLAIIFYILVSKDSKGTGTITIRNNIKDMWAADIDTIYSHALANTQRLFRGKVSSMTSMISEILEDKLDEEFVDEFYDMMGSEADMVPMYVATNSTKINGAGVILYDNLLKDFANRIDSDFFILPSSIHEVLFVPAFSGTDARELISMVREVNASEVADDEILSDNVYRYNRATDRVEMV